MKRNFLFFINPISGTKDKNRLRSLISQAAGKFNCSYQILPTRKDGNYAPELLKIRDEKITDVIICGGDGTVNQVVSSLRLADVNFGIVPMGSGNGLAFAARIPSSSAKAIEIALNAQPSWIDAFTLNGHFSCMLSGVGVDATIAHDFATVKKRGLWTYLKKSTRHFFLSRPFPFTFQIEGQSIKTQAYFISVANSNQFGNYVTIAPKASLNDGMLDIVVVNRMSKMQLIYHIIRQIKMGKVIKPSEANSTTGIYYYQSKEIVIQNSNLAPIHIDGEPIESSSLISVKIIENAFKLIQP